MPKEKSELKRALGKLISEIQKEWGDELGERGAEFSENVMDSAHDLLQAGTVDGVKALLAGRSVRQYLGDLWVRRHPHVETAIGVVEDLLQ